VRYLILGTYFCRYEKGGFAMHRYMLFLSVFMAVAMSFVTPSSVVLTYAQETITIGLVGPMTGDFAADGFYIRQGVQMAVDEINQKGGIHGKMINLIIEDDQMNPRDSANIAQKFVTNKAVIGVIGPYDSSSTMAAGPVYDRGKLVHILGAATSPRVSTLGDYTYRVCPLDSLKGAVMAAFVWEYLKARKAAVIHQIHDSENMFAAAFKENFSNRGGQIVAEETFLGGDKDFTALLSKIKEARPEVIHTGAFYPEAALIVKQAHMLGLTNVKFFDGDACYNPQLMAIGGEDVEGFFIAAMFHPDLPTPRAKEFVKNFKEKYGTLPEAVSALFYDATCVLAEAIDKGGETRDEVMRYVQGIGTKSPALDLVTGPVKFDKNGDVEGKGFWVCEVKGGKFVLVDWKFKP
jgi:branched-chain amino acid transport system substrate-binding protein